MEIQLFIIRHGKSSWDYVMDDIDRPLTERGVKNSYEMAERLKDKNLIPELVLTSPANRAMHTAVIMARVWKLPESRFHLHRGLYLPEEEDIFTALSETDDDVRSVAIFGHNPAFTQFANRFSNQSIDNVPTAGLVIVTLDTTAWNDLLNATVKAVVFDYPKNSRD